MTAPCAEPSRDLTAIGAPRLGQLHLRTQRLELRPLRSQDGELYRGLYTDTDTMRFIGPVLTVRQAARSFKAALRHSTAGTQGPLFITIIERASQLCLGLCVIQPILLQRVETGVVLNAVARGRGIAMESLRAVIEWGLLSLPVDAVWVRCSVHNANAERLFAALGMSRRAIAGSTEVIWSVDLESWQFKQGDE